MRHDIAVDAHRAVSNARAVLAAAVERLAAAGTAPDLLATTVPAHRVLGVIPRRESYRRNGEGFLLGALLITASGDVFEPGRIVRASRQVLPGHQSESARARRELRQRLLDARFAEGSTVVIDARPLPLDDIEALRTERGPLVLRADHRGAAVLIRWMPGSPDDALTPLDTYLRERLELVLGDRPSAPAGQGQA